MKKILIFTNNSFMLWQFRRELISSLVAEGNEVILALPFEEKIPELRALGCRCVHTPLDRRGMNPVTDGKLLLHYRRILIRETPDLVLTYSVKPNVYAGILCRMLGIGRCMHVQGIGTAFQRPLLRPIVTGLYRLGARGARVVFFENQDNARLFREKNIVKKETVCVLPGAGVNLRHFSLREYPGGEPVRLLYLGRLMKEKGVEELFTALEQLRQEGYSFHLDVVGFQEEQWHQRMEPLRQAGVCTDHGFRPDPRPCYENAHCVILPSYHEGMSNVLLEAAATGRPLIASDIPGCREAVADGVSGYLCPPRDVKALKKKIAEFLALPREAREEMGRAGRRKMESEFDRNQVVAQTLAALLQEE